MNSKQLFGTVTGFDGNRFAQGYFEVSCPDAPLHLRAMDLVAGQMMGAQVGDRVRLEYYSTASRGFWHVAEVLGRA
jgi:hypothetical protein